MRTKSHGMCTLRSGCRAMEEGYHREKGGQTEKTRGYESLASGDLIHTIGKLKMRRLQESHDE